MIKNTGYEKNIEALRGFSALMVVISHLLIQIAIFTPGLKYSSYFPSGHLFVLIFFMLSGYVIGLPYRNKPFELGPYIQRRFIRIYPIYIIALLCSYLLVQPSFYCAVANILMLQNILCSPPSTNIPLWSLNYEIIYYLLFALVIPFKKYLGLIISIFIPLTWALNTYTPLFPVNSYLIGYVFWLIGLYFSLHLNHLEKANFSKMLSVLFLLLSCEFINIIKLFFERFGVLHLEVPLPQLTDYAVLPACLHALIVFTQRDFAFKKGIGIIAFAISVVPIPYLILSGKPFPLIPSVFVFLSFVLLIAPAWMEGLFVKVFSWLGGISYAVYVLHIPFMIVFGKISFLSNTWLEFFLKLVLFFPLLFGISFILEKKIQPRIKSYLTTKKEVGA